MVRVAWQRMSAPPETERPQNPLERFTSGGWLKGLLRLGLGVLLVGAVLSFTGRDSWQHLDDPALVPMVGLGALVHLVQRVARTRKWQLMLAPTHVEQRPFRYLLRIQLIGMVANLALPVSEALKVWAVSKSKSQTTIAAKSIVVDLATHTALIGAVGLVAAAVASWWEPAIWAVSAVMLLVPIAVMALARRWPAPLPGSGRIVDLRADVWALAAVETACQASVYAIAFTAIGVRVELLEVLALAPVLYIVDLLNFTPSGLGLREALFAAVLEVMPGASADIGVATGLLISSMLLLATLVGGGFALVFPEVVSPGPGSEA